jgi:Family of unknown function (DUF5677)
MTLMSRRRGKFSDAYASQLPNHQLIDTGPGLSVRAAAEEAGLGAYYDSHYRLYCKFTHAAFGAIMGALDEFEVEDSRTVALCTLIGLEEVVSLGALCPTLDETRQALFRLIERTKQL